MSWTKERMALLKKMWTQGKSAAEIAKKLGQGMTRNAVIGKAHRMGLSSGRPASAPKVAAPAPVKKGAEKFEAAPLPAPGKKPLSKKEAGGISLLEVSDRVCRWPVGDPREDDLYFCGRPSRGGMPYCHDHAVQAYQSVGRKAANEDVADDAPVAVVEDEEEITTT